jgi:hypothetical protein
MLRPADEVAWRALLDRFGSGSHSAPQVEPARTCALGPGDLLEERSQRAAPEKIACDCFRQRSRDQSAPALMRRRRRRRLVAFVSANLSSDLGRPDPAEPARLLGERPPEMQCVSGGAPSRPPTAIKRTHERQFKTNRAGAIACQLILDTADWAAGERGLQGGAAVSIGGHLKDDYEPLSTFRLVADCAPRIDTARRVNKIRPALGIRRQLLAKVARRRHWGTSHFVIDRGARS